MYLVHVSMLRVGVDQKHLIACMTVVSMAVVTVIMVTMAVVTMMVLLGRNNRYECISDSLNFNIFSNKISSDRDFA